jgi:hypothetical protein
MNRIALKIAVAVITFMLGVSCVYLIWLASQSHDIPPLTISQSEINPKK